MIPLPGWFCEACDGWNGTDRGRTICRFCGTPAPQPAPKLEGLGRSDLLRVVAGLSADVVTMQDTLTRCQSRCTELLEEVRALRPKADHVASHVRTIRQRDVYDWVHRVFGDVAMQTEERIRRFVEEALELAQAEGLPMGAVQKLADHVYRRPPGDPAQEVGGVGVTLLAYCQTRGISADDEELREFQRVLSIPPEVFQEKQNQKADAGLAAAVHATIVRAVGLEPIVHDIVDRALTRLEDEHASSAPSSEIAAPLEPCARCGRARSWHLGLGGIGTCVPFTENVARTGGFVATDPSPRPA